MRKLTLKEQIAVFEKQVSRNGRCWLWTGKTNNKGYGSMMFMGKPTGSHVVAWILANGRFPKHNVCHTCDTPKCVKPSHLFDDTQSANLRDMVNKGRANRESWKYRVANLGSKNPASKLSAKAVEDIRRLYASGEYRQSDLALMFDVRHQAISKIVRGERWKPVRRIRKVTLK